MQTTDSNADQPGETVPDQRLVILPMCKESVEEEFREELGELLKKWGAEIEAEDHWTGYAECGSDVRMTVEIPSIYDEHGNMVREWCHVDLGSSIGPK